MCIIGPIEIRKEFVKIPTDGGNVVLTAPGELLNFGDSVPEERLKEVCRWGNIPKLTEGVVMSEKIYDAIVDSYSTGRYVFEMKDKILVVEAELCGHVGMNRYPYYKEGSHDQLLESNAIIEINKENFEISVDIARRFFLCNEEGYICFGQNENGGISYTEVIGDKVTVDELDLDAAISRLLASRKHEGCLGLPQNCSFNLSDESGFDRAVEILRFLSPWLKDGKQRWLPSCFASSGPGLGPGFGPGPGSGYGFGPGYGPDGRSIGVSSYKHAKKRFSLRDFLDFLLCD